MATQEENSLPMGFGTRPWLIQATRSKSLTLVDPLDLSSHESSVPEIEEKTCLGCIHNGEWLMMLDESTHECFLLSLTSTGGDPCRRRKIPLPPLQEPLEFIATCVVLGSPGHPHCTVLVSSTAEAGEPFLLHGRHGDPEWTKLSSPVEGVTFSRGQGMAPTWSSHTAVYVQELGMFGHDGVLTDIVVHRLDNLPADADESAESSMVWRTVESIGSDRAFLLTVRYGYSVSCDVKEGNCVYLVWSCSDCERLYKFCLDDMTSTFNQTSWNPAANAAGARHK